MHLNNALFRKSDPAAYRMIVAACLTIMIIVMIPVVAVLIVLLTVAMILMIPVGVCLSLRERILLRWSRRIIDFIDLQRRMADTSGYLFVDAYHHPHPVIQGWWLEETNLPDYVLADESTLSPDEEDQRFTWIKDHVMSLKNGRGLYVKDDVKIDQLDRSKVICVSSGGSEVMKMLEESDSKEQMG